MRKIYYGTIPPTLEPFIDRFETTDLTPAQLFELIRAKENETNKRFHASGGYDGNGEWVSMVTIFGHYYIKKEK